MLVVEFREAAAALAWSVGAALGKMLCKNSLAGEFVDAVCNRVAIALNTSALPLSAKLTGNALILSGLFVLAVGTPRERKVI